MKSPKVLYILIAVIAFLTLGLATISVLLVVEINKSNTQTAAETTLTPTPVENSDLVTDLEAVDNNDHLQMEAYLDSLPEEDINDDEIAGLLMMREEEKLAHDVYTTLYELWGQKIFNNISNSEQTHTDSVKSLLEKYNIEDPVTTSAVGVFTNPDFTDLYDALVEQGSESLVEALKVGATVEDLDIYDLQELMKKTDNADILAVYQNLLKGSRNHIRSFTRTLNRNGAEYVPAYISQSEYESIIGSPSENSVTYDENGEAL